MATYTITDAVVILPQEEAGINFWTKRRLLAQHGQVRVLWVPGHNVWSRIHGSVYCPAAMALQDITKPANVIRLFEGRFARSRLQKHAKKIAEFLQVPLEIVLKIHPEHTLLVDQESVQTTAN
jgi:hypothetical protein